MADGLEYLQRIQIDEIMLDSVLENLAIIKGCRSADPADIYACYDKYDLYQGALEDDIDGALKMALQEFDGHTFGNRAQKAVQYAQRHAGQTFRTVQSMILH